MKEYEPISIRRAARWPEIGLGLACLLTLLWGALLGILSSNAMYSDPGSFSGVRFAVAGGVAFFVLFLNGFQIGPIWPKGMVMTLLWLFFSFGSLISAMLNQNDVMGELWQMWGVPIVLFCAYPRLTASKSAVILSWSLVIGNLPYIVASLVSYPVATSYYKGVFINSNALGMILACLSSGLFAILRGWINRLQFSLFEKICFASLTLTTILTGVLILFSSSRTSLVAFCLLSVVFISTLFIPNEPHVRLRGQYLLACTLVTMGAALIFFIVVQGVDLSEMIFGKFSVTPGITPLSGREDIWKQIIVEARWFGHGNDYYTGHVGRLPHNSYLAVLGTKGFIAFIALIAFHILALYFAICYALDRIRRDAYSVGPLFIIIVYIVMGITENVGGILGNGLHFAFLMSVGILITNFSTCRRVSKCPSVYPSNHRSKL